MNPSYPYDPDLHEPGSVAGQGRCSVHAPEVAGDAEHEPCAGEPVVSFQDADGQWRSGCQSALERLVESGEIEPLGQGA